MRDAKLAAAVLAASLAYAIVRYNVFGGVGYDQLPVFVTNKATAVASLVLIGMSRLVADKSRRKHLGLLGLALAAVHVMLSLIVLDPSYFPAHYQASGKLRWNGETSMLAGVVATALLFWLGYATTTMPVDKQPAGRSLLRGVARIALALVAVHTVLLGYTVWMDASKWPGTMPPITLLSFAIAVGFLLIRRASR